MLASSFTPFVSPTIYGKLSFWSKSDLPSVPVPRRCHYAISRPPLWFIPGLVLFVPPVDLLFQQMKAFFGLETDGRVANTPKGLLIYFARFPLHGNLVEFADHDQSQLRNTYCSWLRCGSDEWTCFPSRKAFAYSRRLLTGSLGLKRSINGPFSGRVPGGLLCWNCPQTNK